MHGTDLRFFLWFLSMWKSNITALGLIIIFDRLIFLRLRNHNVARMKIIIPPGGYTVLPLSFHLSVFPSVQDILLSNYWWQKSDIWSQASYRYAILWEAFLDPSDSYFLFDDLVGFYRHWTYMWGYHKWALAHIHLILYALNRYPRWLLKHCNCFWLNTIHRKMNEYFFLRN